MVVLGYKVCVWGGSDKAGRAPSKGSSAVKAPLGSAAWLLLHLDTAVLHQSVLPDPVEPSRTAQLLPPFALYNVSSLAEHTSVPVIRNWGQRPPFPYSISSPARPVHCSCYGFPRQESCVFAVFLMASPSCSTLTFSQTELFLRSCSSLNIDWTNSVAQPSQYRLVC